MNKVFNWVKSHKWVILVALTALTAISLLFVDKDGVDDNTVDYEVVE